MILTTTTNVIMGVLPLLSLDDKILGQQLCEQIEALDGLSLIAIESIRDAVSRYGNQVRLYQAWLTVPIVVAIHRRGRCGRRDQLESNVVLVSHVFTQLAIGSECLIAATDKTFDYLFVF